MVHSETIAAIATGLSDSGIGIVRVSGDDAISIVNKIYRTCDKNVLSRYESHTIHYGFIYDGEELVDEVMVSVFKSPKSYTTEDTVEINCHGGILVVKKVLETVIKNGARIAEPGEFTKRAFLNGRIDLSQAEAVMDVIHAKNDLALRASVKQVRGNLADLISGFRKEILYQIAFIESALDDPEHISLDGYQEDLSKKLDVLIQKIHHLYKTADNGKLVKEGINTVIVGKPNAGKSSLLNLLAGEEKAIVTEIAGTTRDIIEETVNLGGISLNVIDTAGIRHTQDTVEKIGVQKAREYAADADLIIYVVDSSVELDENDHSIIDLIRSKKVIVLLNKIDLDAKVDKNALLNCFSAEDSSVPGKNQLAEYGDNTGSSAVRIVEISAKNAIGVDKLEKTIEEMFFAGEIKENEEVFLSNIRQKELVKDALDSLTMVKKSIEDGMPEDFLSIDLMGAYTSLGYIIGEEVGEDVVNEIFSKFCMGK